jgi:carboxymethylenebutenolidase
VSRQVLVVDGANVVGSRPDGWWRDRAGAARRLADGLAALAGGPEAPARLVLVLEGAARRGVPAGDRAGVEVVHAPGSGDDEVVRQVGLHLPTGHGEEGPRGVDVVVITADRGLRARVEPLGARVLGPSALRRLLPAPVVAGGGRPGTIATTTGGRADEERCMDSGSRQNVTFPSNGGQAHGYLAVPADGTTGPAVVVIQEWWGLTDHMADVVDRLAAEGFVALAPDLYGGRTTHDAGEAAQMMSSLPVEQAAKDLGGAVDFLLGHERVSGGKVGAVGFCMGGGFVLQLGAEAGEKVAAVVSFYGVFPHGEPDFSTLRAEVLGHFGERDDFAPPEKALALEQQIREQSGVEVNFHYYDAGHAFYNDANPLGTHDPQAARLAWTRTLEFLRSRLA